MIRQRRRLNGLPGPVIGALLIEIVDTPALPGARCVEHVALFDRTIGNGSGPSRSVRQSRDEARAVCETCPALDACGAWVRATARSQRPAGIVAGVFVDVSGRFAADRAHHRVRHAK